MKKKLLSLIALGFMTVMSVNAQSQKIKITESAYIQGGETALEAFGVSKPETLLVLNSKGNTKFARTTFLKFKLPEGLDQVKSAELALQIKVFKDRIPSDSKFDLDVQAVPNCKWSSQSITFSNAPKAGSVLASAKIDQSADNKFDWVSIKLDVEAVNELIKDSKKRAITIALANNVASTFGASIGKDSFLILE